MARGLARVHNHQDRLPSQRFHYIMSTLRRDADCFEQRCQHIGIGDYSSDAGRAGPSVPCSERGEGKSESAMVSQHVDDDNFSSVINGAPIAEGHNLSAELTNADEHSQMKHDVESTHRALPPAHRAGHSA